MNVNEEGTQVSEAPAPVVEQLVGGEVHIVIDPVSGSLQLKSPANNLITLAIIEAAKVFVAMQMQEAMRRAMPKQAPAIIPGNPALVDKMSKLLRPS